MRNHEPHAGADDPDRTDELPQLDPVAYAAHLKALEDKGGTDSTDTWLVPQPLDLHTARINQLEGELRDREAELHALQGDLEHSASTKNRLDGELNGILARIADLEARLQEAVEANAALTSANDSLTTERSSLQSRCEALEDRAVKLTEAQLRGDVRTKELETELVAERAQGATRIAELESRIVAETGAAASAVARVAGLQSDLEAARTSLKEAALATGTLETQVAEQSAAAGRIAMEYAVQLSLGNNLRAALETTHGAIQTLERALSLREQQVAALQDEIIQKAIRIEELEGAVATRDRTIVDLTADVGTRDLRIVDLNERIATQAGAIAAFMAEKLTLEENLAAERKVLEHDRTELSARDVALEQAQEALAREQATTLHLQKELELRKLALDESGARLATSDRAVERTRQEAAGLAEELAGLRSTLESTRLDLEKRTAEALERKNINLARDRSLAAADTVRERLEAEVEAKGLELERLGTDLKSQADRLDETEAALAGKEDELRVALSEREALRERETGLRAAFAKLEHEHSAALEGAARETHALREMGERLAGLEKEATARTEQLADRALTISALESAMATLRTRSDELETELASARSKSETLGTELLARESAVVTLRSELAAHVEALGAIRRDINRIESGRAVEPAPLPLRYLIAVDSNDLVHVLNRKIMTLGRTSENDLQIRSTHISRHHARLLVGPASVILEDLGSTNGCYVNGRRVRKQVLQNEDVLMIGKTRFRFTSKAAPEAPSH